MLTVQRFVVVSARIRRKAEGDDVAPFPSPEAWIWGLYSRAFFYFHIAVHEFKCISAWINYSVLRGLFNLIVRPDLKNMGIAVEVSLCI